MTSAQRTEETPKERLQRVASYSLPRAREVVKRNYWIGVALLVLILAMLAVALIGGSGATGIMRAHTELIKRLALPFWQ